MVNVGSYICNALPPIINLMCCRISDNNWPAFLIGMHLMIQGITLQAVVSKLTILMYGQSEVVELSSDVETHWLSDGEG